MADKNLPRNPVNELPEKELRILDEFILVLAKVNSFREKISINHIAYIIKAVLSEKDVQALKETL